jgi:type II restriction/modification system DNA methylase subunit YeeA
MPSKKESKKEGKNKMLEKANEYQKKLDDSFRAKFGVHYTNESTILKIINPTITDPLKRIKSPRKRLERIQNIKILDPACGCGNFLVVAFRELKILELKTISQFKRKPRAAISPLQFFGMDIDKKAIEIAKESLIALCENTFEYLLFNFNYTIEDLDDNIICKDALFSEWEQVDAIIGNPPFLGRKKQSGELGVEYAKKVRELSSVRGQVDLCAYWYPKAHQNRATRCGFVSTNNICKGASKQASLDYIIKHGGIITNAVSSEKWQGDAAVHISIINWTKDYQGEEIVLDGEPVDKINASLYTGIDFRLAPSIEENKDMAFKGCVFGGKGFEITEEQRELFLADGVDAKLLPKLIGGDTITNPNRRSEFVVDLFQKEDLTGAQLLMNYLEKHVKPEREKNNSTLLRKNWWLFSSPRPALRTALKDKQKYIAIPQVSKYVFARLFDANVIPDGGIICIASESKTLWGILSSSIHTSWVKKTCSTLKQAYSYNVGKCFETFPIANTKRHSDANCLSEAIANKMYELEEYRVGFSLTNKCTLTELYNKKRYVVNSKLNKLHVELDKLVCQLYGFPYRENGDYCDLLKD